MPSAGFLAIWSDVTAEQETDYLHWLTREHTSERVGINGFAGSRVFRAEAPSLQRYFILYELASPAVLSSDGYLARLNAPSAWSQRIMPILGNFVRGGGEVAATAGVGEGGVVLPLLLADGGAAMTASVVAELVKQDRIVAVRWLKVDQAGTTIRTNEKAMRQDDRSFAAMVLIEAIDIAAVEQAVDWLRRSNPGLAPKDSMIYRQVFAIRSPLQAKAAS